MTSKEYLSEIRWLYKAKKECERMIAELSAEMTATGAIRYDKDKVQNSLGNIQEERAIKYIELKSKYETMAKNYHEGVLIRVNQINAMPNKKYAEILTYRFVKVRDDGRLHTLGWIAEELNYSESRVKHLYTEALEAFEDQFLKS